MSGYTMVYDLETVPDCEMGRRLLDLTDASDEAVLARLKEQRLEKTKGASDFLPHYLQRIVAISVLVSGKKGVKIWSLGQDANEKDLIERFFSGIETYSPTLVSWNGSGFDLPVLHYRTLLHGVVAKRYWDQGESNSEFRWNNYLNRYHLRHVDLMDILAGYQSKAYAPLNELAVMLGLPGKMGMEGSLVFEKLKNNELSAIRDYCETDVLNTYLIYLCFQHMRGFLTNEMKVEEEQRIKDFLKTSNKAHWQAFLEAWGK